MALQPKLTLSSISLALHPSLPFHLAFILSPNLPLSLSLSFPFISTIPTHSFPFSFPGSGTHMWSHMCILNSPILSPLNPLNLLSIFFLLSHTRPPRDHLATANGPLYSRCTALTTEGPGYSSHKTCTHIHKRTHTHLRWAANGPISAPTVLCPAFPLLPFLSFQEDYLSCFASQPALE